MACTTPGVRRLIVFTPAEAARTCSQAISLGPTTLHHKTGELVSLPLSDRDGPLFPELTAYLDRLQRLGVPIVLMKPKRGDKNRAKPAKPYLLRTARNRVRAAARAAKLPDHLTRSMSTWRPDRAWRCRTHRAGRDGAFRPSHSGGGPSLRQTDRDATRISGAEATGVGGGGKAAHRGERDRSSQPGAGERMMTCRQNERVTEWKAGIANLLILLVGAAGFEPAAPCSQSRCYTAFRCLRICSQDHGILPEIA